MNTVRWNIAVSPETDQAVRLYLARNGGGRKGDLSRFIEEAVRASIFERTVDQIKASNANIDETELTSMIDEALEWAHKG